MIKFEKVKAGMRLYDYHSYRMGNTTYRAWDNWPVDILEVHEHFVVASWNFNTPKKMFKREVERLRAKPGKVKNPFAR